MKNRKCSVSGGWFALSGLKNRASQWSRPEMKGIFGWVVVLASVGAMEAAESGASPQHPLPGAEQPQPSEDSSPASRPSKPMLAGRLIDQDPYDRIYLDAANRHAVLDVFPLDLPGRQLPKKPTGPLIIRLLNRPETRYELPWSAIVKVELFEQRVLEEGKQYVQQGRFEEAYEYFRYLYEHYPKLAGLDAAYQEALWQEAGQWYRQGQYARSLAVLRTLWEKNKEWPLLDRAMGMAVERLVEQYVSAEQYESARAMLRQLANWYPDHPGVSKWQEQFQKEATVLQAQAKAALQENALRTAFEAARKMIQLCPHLPGAQELWEEVRQKYPRVVVGVCLPARMPAASTLPTEPPSPAESPLEQPPIFVDRNWWALHADWATWRTSRLLGRQWMEMVGLGSEGGQYRFPLGSFRMEDLGRRLIFQLRPNVLDGQGKELTGYRLTDWLLKLADPDRIEYRPEWADRVKCIWVKDIYTVEVILRRAHVRPEAFLSAPIADLPGPYLPHPPAKHPHRADSQCVFLLNSKYFAVSASQPKEIVEIPFSRPREALAALQAGKVDLVDRIPPSEVGRLRESKQIVVGQYALPVLHLLVLNPNRPLLANCRFRRALEYGIDREAILAQICGVQRNRETELGWEALGTGAALSGPPAAKGKKPPSSVGALGGLVEARVRFPPGFSLLSAPIPMGVSYKDPIGYAYDRQQKPRFYHPRLALALAKLAWAEVSGRAQEVLESSRAGGKGATASERPPVFSPSVSRSESKGSASGLDREAPKQPSSAKSPSGPPALSTPTPAASTKAPASSSLREKAAWGQKQRADPFPEEASGESSMEKPPEASPEKLPGEESAKAITSPTERPGSEPSGQQVPKEKSGKGKASKQPTDPFSEQTAIEGTGLGSLGGGRILAGWGGESSGGREWGRGERRSMYISTSSDPFAELPATEKKPSSDRSSPNESVWKDSPAVKADPFAEEQAKPKSPESALPKPASAPETIRPEQPPPVEKPSASQKAPTKSQSIPEKPSKKTSGEAGESAATEKPVSLGPPEKKSPLPLPIWKKPSEEYLLEMPPLRLVHPPTEPARSACWQIRQMLRRIGIPCQLQQVEPAELFGPTPPEFDIAYVEIMIQEPVVDLPRLLQQTIPPGQGRSVFTIALAELYQAPGWPEVRQSLYQLHQISAQELPIIPLWQTIESFAYRRGLEGLGPRVVHLYENVENWRIVEQNSESLLETINSGFPSE